VASPRWVGHRLANLARGLVDTFLRDNRLLPPVLALIALFVFAWVLAGVFLGGTEDQKPVAHRSEIAQADDTGGSNPAVPKVDNPNVDSYAAYRSKDPFREIIAQATTPEGTTATTPERTSSAPPEQTTGAGGGNGRGADSDGDGLPDRKEASLGQDPNKPDTDGDGIPDGLDDANGDGVPDGASGGAAAGGGNNRSGGGGGGRGAGSRQGRGGDLLDSGGTLSPP
jgi:hypothetical protein